MKKSWMSAVCMAAVLFTYAVVCRAQTAGDNSSDFNAQDQQQQQQQQPGQLGDQMQPGQQGAGMSAIQAGSLQQATWDKDMERSFIEHAISCNQFEIQSAQLAQQKAQDPQVKQLAQTLENDHKQAQQQIKDAAKAVGVSDMEKIQPVQKAQLEELRKLDGAQFDRAYIYTQVGDHQMDVLKFRDAAQNAQDQQVQKYASQTLPTLRQHLDRAEQIAGVEQSRTASEMLQPGNSDLGTGAGMGTDTGTGTGTGASGSDLGNNGGGMGGGSDSGAAGQQP